MRSKRFLAGLGAAMLAALLSACGGGGGGTSTSGDINPFVRAAAVATGLDRFLLYPNPIVSTAGVFEVGAEEYAVAYYEAIDPTNAKDTLAKWKLANNIGVTTGGHKEYYVTIGDQRDLGYGRRMTAHQNPDGTMAFMVANYLVGAYGGYTPLNVEAAVRQVPEWHLGTNAIEFSPGPNGAPGQNFVKFYTFDPKTGARLNTLSLDGRPSKAMPTVCSSCHGGRGDPLTPPHPVTGKKLFPLVANSNSQHRGDMQAQLHPFEPAAFDFSTIPGNTRAELEAGMKAINKMVLCSFSLPTGTVKPTPLAEDNCRRVASINEYQGSAAEHLKAMYGGGTARVTATDGMPDATSEPVDNYVEATWTAAGQDALYLQAQAPACRVCHLLRGTGNNEEISFAQFQHFDAYKDRIKVHMVDRGNMPLAKLIYDKFRSTASMVQALGDYLVAAGFPDGRLAPERPIADPGPDRVLRQGATTLSAAMSLYSNSYQWSIFSGPAGASLSNAASATPVFNATADGVYQIRLVTSNATATSNPVLLTVKVDNLLPYNPTALRFSDVKNVLQLNAGNCTQCHQDGGNGTVIPPIWYSSYDRSGTGDPVVNDRWFYTELRGRINFTDWIASPLLRKPSNALLHNGGQRTGFNTALPVGDPSGGRADYDLLVNWIVNGAPE